VFRRTEVIIAVKSQRIIKAYKILQSIMGQYGKKISFPNNTDPRKTYSWRYLSKFIDRYDQLELGDQVMTDVLGAMVTEAHNKKYIGCGVSLLNKVDIITVYHKTLETEIDIMKKQLANIKKSFDFLDQKEKELKQDKCTLLANRPHKKSYTFLTRWYDSGFLSIEYIMVSKSCRQVLKNLGKDERLIFPKFGDLMKIYLKLTREEIKEQICKILGNDFHKEKILF